MHYAINDRRCHACTHRQNSTQHMRSCVPKRYWPEDATLSVHDPVASIIRCECGAEMKNERGLRLHRLKSKAHREVMNG